MTLGLELELLADTLGRLPMHAGHASEGLPGHAFLGAVFLFIGSLLVVETLAGGVWRRRRLRMMLWPAALLFAGTSMLIVTYLQSTEKPLHFTLALLLLLGGVFEGRYRLGQISRSAADAFAIPALIVAGVVVGPMHANGSFLHSAVANMHLLAGLAAWALAGVKLMRVHYGPTMALDAGFATGVMALGLSLLLVEQFHGSH
jgi:hypothetical protein